ncbi:MAG: hypothetical protein ACTSPI_13865, partial [Candidatus Heimdallarchaeaceae archaeon]
NTRKKMLIKKKATKKPVNINRDAEIVELIMREVYNIFDSVPRDAVNRGAVQKLVQKINEIK